MERMMKLTKEEKIKRVNAECEKHIVCEHCPIRDSCRRQRVENQLFDEYAHKIYDACIDFFEPTSDKPRIAIRDIIDLLDYDRTGIRTVRIVDEDKADLLYSHSDSYLLEYIGDTPVNAIDVIEGVLTMYVNYGKSIE